ncbi:MAG: outer membrane protein transport protein [Planctomycetota bacterium]|nr:outer membrane protein transport protein [Planctomycetota bacterium]
MIEPNRILNRKLLRACLLMALVLSVTATPADAQFGPMISGTGAVNRSMGGASTAAPLAPGGALLWNPATLSGLEGSQIEIGAELLLPHSTLSSSVPANTFGPGVPPIDLSGSTRSDDGVFALPTMALMHRPDGSPFTYGLGIFGVAGFGLNYPGSATNPVLTAPAPNGIGLGPIFSQYQVLQIAPALVYDVDEQLSISFSPLLDLGVLQLDPAVIAAPDNANGDPFSTYPSGTHSRAAWGAGFNVGAYYKADDDWSFGTSYKSPQWFQSYSFNTTDELGQPRRDNYNLDLPAIISVGTAYKGIDRTLLAVDLRYLDFASTNGWGDSGYAPNGALRGVGFQSIFAVALGAQYEITDATTLRLGYSWSENPIPAGQTAANVASPLIIQHILSAGMSYKLTDAFSLSVAYSHGFENSSTGPIVLPGGAVPGTSLSSRASVDSFLVGATVKFGGPKCRAPITCSEEW